MKNTILFLKKIAVVIIVLLTNYSVSQTYEFQTVKEINCTPVVSQGKTGTCWSFSSTSFLESEIMRITGKTIDLSEMYSVRQTYPKKALNYVMRQGKAQFGEGGLNHDVINSALEFGLVPESVYSGKGTSTEFDHTKMVVELEKIVKTTVENPTPFNTNWKASFEAVLDQYMGKNVTEFMYDGKNYTPKQFLEFTGLKLDNYVTITSFTHEPYHTKFILNIPDNFANGSMYNLPLDEFISSIDNSLEKGFTVALDADVSEKSFSGQRGIAVVPFNDTDIPAVFKEIKKEKTITPELRQAEFENLNTTDDHLMHIVGKVKDQNGTIYYKVKNSWGKDSGKEGYVYMSVSYLRLKAISVLIHKDALNKKTRSILGILY
jgi:bleomycin hydrolase